VTQQRQVRQVYPPTMCVCVCVLGVRVCSACAALTNDDTGLPSILPDRGTSLRATEAVQRHVLLDPYLCAHRWEHALTWAYPPLQRRLR
jgi:hypothetical protein